MSSNPYAQFTGTRMDDDDVAGLLRSQGYGVLSLCRDGVPYSIPMSFGYDGEAVYFGFIEESPDPEKMSFVSEGATARLLVTDVRGRFDWRSVAVTGPVSSVSRGSEEWDHLMETLDDNGWFMRSFERSDAVRTIYGWRLAPEEVRGHERTEAVYD
jgi:hypothetical protein